MPSLSKNEFVHQTEVLLSDIDFKLIFLKIINYKWLIIGVTLFIFTLGILYTLSMKPNYVSTALIQVDSQLGSANNIQQMLGTMSTSISSIEKASPAEIEIALIQSRFILQSVIDKFKLLIRVSPHHFPILGTGLAEFYHGYNVAKPLFGMSQFAWGGEHINIELLNVDSPLAETNFNLRVEGNDRYSLFSSDGSLLLQGSVGKVMSTPLGINPQVKLYVTKISSNTGTFFTISLRHNDDVLMELSQNLSVTDLGYKSKTKTGIIQLSYQGSNPKLIASILNTIIDIAIQRNIEKKSAEARKTLDFLNKQLPSVRKSLENAETNLNEYRTKSGTIDITQEAKIILMQLSTVEQSIAEVKLKKVEMLQELTPQHPYVIAINQKQMQLQKEVFDLEKKIKTLPGTDQKALSLERDVKVKNQLYLLLLNNIQQLQVLKAGTLSDIRVLSQASIPIVPLSSHKSFILLCSIIVGFFISLATIFIRDLFQNKVTDHELIEEKLGISTYAIIPYSEKQKKINIGIKRGIYYNKCMMLAQESPKDIAIEAIRSLRTILQFNLEQAKNNIICLLGASPSIGKSFVSINLSCVLAECGKRVLLIDADMRKGKLNQYFSQKKSPGLSELLSNGQSINAVINKINNNLYFISSGAYPTNPSELLMTTKLNKLMYEFSQVYDIVIVDTSPILAVTDAIILAKLSATNIMVVGAGSDKIEELELMVKRTRKNGIEIQGFVLNNILRINHAYRKYNYYYAYEAQE